MTEKLVRSAGTGLQMARHSMLLVTTDQVPGSRVIKVLGLVRGNTVRTRNFGADFFAGLRGIVGGEVNQYTSMLAQSREQALDRLRAEAHGLGANAVTGLRITTSTVMHGAAEILAYGTAVIVEPA
jgi:uncharacterized protein YbjQ (UPF0145 family)